MSDQSSHPTPDDNEPGQPPVMDHAYDGIREYDNPLPAWWSWIFIGTIVFSGFYFFMAMAMDTNVLSATYAYDQDVLADTERTFASKVFKPDAKTLMELQHDDRMLSVGKSIFQTNCAQCHGRNAEGLVGPNLTDNYYIHVKRIEDFPDVITNGRKSNTMPAWKNKLSPNQIVVVGAYVASLRGTNLPGKPPEGTVPAPWTDK
jgi:cytochrome c oxidase cbb3-type subunit 3